MLSKNELLKLIEIEEEIYDATEDDIQVIFTSGRIGLLKYILEKYYKD